MAKRPRFRSPLSYLPIPLAGACTFVVALSWIWRHSQALASLRLTFTIIFGVGAGIWIMVSRRIVRPWLRMLVAVCVVAVLILLLASINHSRWYVSGPIVLLLLYGGAVGWHLFLRTLTSDIRGAGGVVPFLRSGLTRSALRAFFGVQ